MGAAGSLPWGGRRWTRALQSAPPLWRPGGGGGGGGEGPAQQRAAAGAGAGGRACFVGNRWSDERRGAGGVVVEAQVNQGGEVVVPPRFLSLPVSLWCGGVEEGESEVLAWLG